MIKGTLGSGTTTLATLRKCTDGFGPLATMLESLYVSGVEIDWNEYHREYSNSQNVLELPRYCWDLKRYWIDYRNDFCLLKGEKEDHPKRSPNIFSSQIPQYKFLSPAVQKVIEETHGTKQSTVITESDIFDARLLPVLQGHLVNGAALCPSVSKSILRFFDPIYQGELSGFNSPSMLISLSPSHTSWWPKQGMLSNPLDSMWRP